MPEHALELRVIELADSVAGAYCGKLLAGFGAAVVKVERPERGDPLRAHGPFPDDEPHPERSGLFLHLNTGKQSVTLDYASESGKRILRRLLDDADVLIDGAAPGVLDDLGLGHAALAESNPKLVTTSVTAFGQSGPYRDLHSTELTRFALSGYMDLTGFPDREPLKTWGYLGEYMGGVCAALGTMSALAARDESGRGQHVDHSVFESMLILLGMPPFEYRYLGEVYKRAGNDTPGVDSSRMPPKVLPTSDGYVQMHRGHEGMLTLLTGEPRLEEPDLPREEYAAMLGPWLAAREKEAVARDAQELRLPYTEVNSPADLLRDVQHEARGVFATVQHPVAGELRQPGAPFKLSATPWETRPAPLLGEHNLAVYGGQLGYSAQEITQLRQRGVI